MKLFFDRANKIAAIIVIVSITIQVYTPETLTMRFTAPPSTAKTKVTLPFRPSFNESCDYLAHYCLRAYSTGSLCARTAQYLYHSFKNYCLMDYVNCMERYEVWQIVHMGECFDFPQETEYALYHYDDDDFLNETYVIEDH